MNLCNYYKFKKLDLFSKELTIMDARCWGILTLTKVICHLIPCLTQIRPDRAIKWPIVSFRGGAPHYRMEGVKPHIPSLVRLASDPLLTGGRCGKAKSWLRMSGPIPQMVDAAVSAPPCMGSTNALDPIGVRGAV